MNFMLIQYLANVFKRGVGANPSTESESNSDYSKPLIDRNLNPFIVDKKYSLRLDEII